MIATIINSAAVAAGGLIGLLAKKGLPERVSKGIMTAIGLMLICAGVKDILMGTAPSSPFFLSRSARALANCFAWRNGSTALANASAHGFPEMVVPALGKGW